MNELDTTTLVPPPTIPEPVQVVEDPLKEVKDKLTDAEKDQFFKCFLADQPYISEESLFNGKLQLKFSSLSIKENNTVMLQMQFDREQNIAKNTDAYLLRIIQYRVAASLVEVDHKVFTPEINEANFPSNAKEGTTYLVKKLEVMADWPLYKVSAITDCFNKFEKKLRALTEESFKENF